MDAFNIQTRFISSQDMSEQGGGGGGEGGNDSRHVAAGGYKKSPSRTRKGE